MVCISNVLLSIEVMGKPFYSAAWLNHANYTLSGPYEPREHYRGCWGPTHLPFKVGRHAFHLSLATCRGSYLPSGEAWRQPSPQPGRSALQTCSSPSPSRYSATPFTPSSVFQGFPPAPDPLEKPG